jgi:hypothetical protein
VDACRHALSTNFCTYHPTGGWQAAAGANDNAAFALDRKVAFKHARLGRVALPHHAHAVGAAAAAARARRRTQQQQLVASVHPQGLRLAERARDVAWRTPPRETIGDALWRAVHAAALVALASLFAVAQLWCSWRLSTAHHAVAQPLRAVDQKQAVSHAHSDLHGRHSAYVGGDALHNESAAVRPRRSRGRPARLRPSE